MQEIRRGNERGHADHGWLNSYHSLVRGLEAGDALKLTGSPRLALGQATQAEVLVFDLPELDE